MEKVNELEVVFKVLKLKRKFIEFLKVKLYIEKFYVCWGCFVRICVLSLLVYVFERGLVSVEVGIG